MKKINIILTASIIFNLLLPAYSLEKANRNKWEVIYSTGAVKLNESLQIIITGDIMLGRSIADICIRKNNFNYPFEKIIPYIKSDVFIGNLESPLTSCVRQKHGPYILKAPVKFAPYLKFCDFTVLSLANNHSLDAGPDGLKQCVEVLNKESIYTAGAGKDNTEALRGIDLYIKKISLKIFAFNTVKDPEDKENEYKNYCRAWLNKASIDAIKKADSLFDYIIVIIHWGEELEKEPSSYQIKLGEKLINAGADIITGSHPHVLQRTDLVTCQNKKCVVFYSLGNFIFDQYSINDTKKSALFKIVLTKNRIDSLYKLPVVISNGQVLAEGKR